MVMWWAALTHVCEDLLPVGHDIPLLSLLYHPRDTQREMKHRRVIIQLEALLSF